MTCEKLRSRATGTMAFKAPETFKDWYSEASDMFSMGVTSFEVASRKDPFDGESMHALALVKQQDKKARAAGFEYSIGSIAAMLELCDRSIDS